MSFCPMANITAVSGLTPDSVFSGLYGDISCLIALLGTPASNIIARFSLNVNGDPGPVLSLVQINVLFAPNFLAILS